MSLEPTGPRASSKVAFRGAKDDIETPRASTAATLNCNLLLNHANSCNKSNSRLWPCILFSQPRTPQKIERTETGSR